VSAWGHPALRRRLFPQAAVARKRHNAKAPDSRPLRHGTGSKPT